MRLRRPPLLRLLALLLVLAPLAASGGEAKVAVASNFATPAKRAAEAFAERSGHRVVVSTGSTGKLYAQIASGAPFDVLIAADSASAVRLEREGLAVEGSAFVYAVGKLALWSADPARVDDAGRVLRRGDFRKLAIANPRLAPYGAAAREAMEKLGVWQALQPKLVFGESIAQAFQFVASGNAELGFVALAQLREPGGRRRGSTWIVPPELHAPLRQEAVLLARGAGNSAARGFLEFLRSDAARQLIAAYGYELP